MDKTVWVLSRRYEDDREWTIRGVFTTKEKAVALCKENLDCVGPMILDSENYTIAGKQNWEGAYYPFNKGE